MKWLKQKLQRLFFSKKTKQVIEPTKNPSLPIAEKSVRDNYELLEDHLVDDFFFHLRSKIYSRLDAKGRHLQSGQAVFRDTGILSPKRPYFFLKPDRRSGLLFERTNSGWMICQADHVKQRDLFLRKGQCWDHVLLYGHRTNPKLPRLSSQAFEDPLMSFPVYEKKLLRKLGLLDANEQNS